MLAHRGLSRLRGTSDGIAGNGGGIAGNGGSFYFFTLLPFYLKKLSLIHELNHVLASWLCLWRFIRITQGDAVEQLVILGECHAVEVRLG